MNKGQAKNVRHGNMKKNKWYKAPNRIGQTHSLYHPNSSTKIVQLW